MRPTRPRNEALLAWYREHRRDLPWRNSGDPYRILVSEVMLQQTQVERVVPRYLRFLERFPTAADLAAATTGEVIAEWNGLGYNVRARRLHETARLVTAQGWPGNADGLRHLPGVGPYTAAAVASFAFGHRVAAVDTNLRRVISRWLGRPLHGAELEREAAAMVPSSAADWNQAVMDLAASHCRPRTPRCADCPVATWCADPSLVVAPARQPPFQGSMRQVRGAVIRHLSAAGPATLEQLAAAVDLDRDRVARAVDGLEADRLVEQAAGEIRLPR